MNRITNAVTRSNFGFVLYLWGSRISSIFREPCSDIPDKECTTGAGFFIISLYASSWSPLEGRGSWGQFSLDFFRNSGPLNQFSAFASSGPEHPRDGKSAGFKCPGQCLHSKLFVSCLISLLGFVHISSITCDFESSIMS